MARAQKPSTPGDNLDVLCKHCGQALYDFLQQMEEHNAEVVCPSCGRKHIASRPAKGTRNAPPRKP